MNEEPRQLPLNQIFTEAQLEEAANILFTSAVPHSALVSMLKPDKARFDVLEIDINYAAYILEWQRDAIVYIYKK